jgi:tRNA (mo5U34)-methyltransferase
MDSTKSDAISRVMSREWFYSYELPDGQKTLTYHEESVDSIHDTRWRMLNGALQYRYAGEFSELTAIDLACHQGYFAVKLAQAGFSAVTAIDARQSHVDDSELIAEAYGLGNMTASRSDLFDLDASQTGTFDLVMMLGLLYHLENPIGALRIARALCRDACIIETQIVPGLTGYVDYGSYQFVRPLKGSFGIIDEIDDTQGLEASITGISLVPSLEGLVWILYQVGFGHVEILEPPDDAYEQLLHKKRVMIVASVDKQE